MSDLISRQAAIEACIRVQEHHAYDEIEEIKALPSAQPETHDKRTETHACDLISRQAAVDALTRKMVSIPTAGEKDLMGDVNRIRAEDISVIRRLPSAQPEKDMIHLQKEQAYMQGWEEGRNALREEIWENERDRLD